MKILVVDDEISARKTICSIISQNIAYEIEIVQASSGYEAWRILEATDIHLLISDIRMPEMDGITLAKKARENGKNCGIIFISAYDHKEYLKAAIELNSIAYIDKPIDKNKLLKVLDDVMKKINDEIGGSVGNKEQSSTELIEYLISSKGNEKKIEKLLDEVCGRDTDDLVFTASVLKFRCLKESYLSGQILENKLKECSDKDLKMIFRQKDKNTYILIFISSKGVDIKEQARKKILGIQSEMSDRILFLTAIGQAAKNYKGVYKSYEDCACLMQCGFYSNYGIIDDNVESTSSVIDITKRIDDFNRVLENPGKSHIFDFFEELYNEIKTAKNLPVMVAVFLFKQILYQMYLKLYNKDKADDYDSVLKYINTENAEFLIFDELYDYVITEAEQMIEESKADNVVYEIKNYIEKIYTNPDVRLQEISERFHLSIGYMCSKFRNIAGVSINNYLTSVRIRHAKELIKEGKFSAEQITYMVGYNDPNYFSRNFKKHTGMTISEYRKKNNE